MAAKKLLIVTGPQGSGNHLFSKLFSAHPDVFGWKQLLDDYWVLHEYEPFNHVWLDPSKWSTMQIQENFAFTSISVPFVKLNQPHIPKFDEFIREAESQGWQVQIGFVGREQSIMKFQQERLRGGVSFHHAQQALETIMDRNPIFLSYELLGLYKHHYARSLQNQLQFPIDCCENRIHRLTENDHNRKYIQFVDRNPFDDVVKDMMNQAQKKGD